MLEFRTLGTIDLRGDDGRRIDSVLARSKAVSLLAYLCTAYPPRLHRRDTLIALLWPELDDVHARGALRQELSRLRRGVGADVLVGEGGESLGINRERLWSDAAAFEEAVAGGRGGEGLDLWRGEFLPGFHVESGEFERWLDETRDRLARRAIQAAGQLVTAAQQAGDLAGAVTAARRLIELAPYDETGWQRLISLLDRSGDRAGALAAYDAMEARLREELEVEPSPETRALVERVRGRGEAFASAGAVATGSPPTLPSAPALSVGPDSHPSESRITQGEANRAHARVWRWLVPAALVLTATAGALATALLASRRSARPSYTLVDVRPLDNETGDPALSHLAKRATALLERGLTDAAHVDLAEGDSADQATAVLSGRLYRRGPLVEVRTQLREAGPNGRILEMPEPVTFRPEEPDFALDTLVARVIVAIAFRFDPRFDASSAPGRDLPTKRASFEAFKEYNDGAELFGSMRFAQGAEHLLRAYKLDPGFAKAAAFGAIALAYSGDPAGGDSVARAAAAIPSGYEYDHLFAEWVVAEINGRRADAYRTMRQVTQIGPSTVMRIIAGREALWLNRPREALAFLHGVDMEHGWWRNWSEKWEDHGAAYHMLGDHKSELAIVLEGRARFPVALDLIRAETRARAGLGQPDEALRLISEAATLRPAVIASFPPLRTTPADIAWTAAQELDEHAAREAAARARRLGLQWLEARPDITRADSLLRARLLLESGDAGRAQRLLARMAPYEDLESVGLTGLVAARRGDAPEARLAIARLQRWPDRYANGRPLLLAAGIHAALREPDQAMQTLRMSLEAGVCFSPELEALPMLRPLAARSDFADLMRPRSAGARPRWWARWMHS